MLLQRRHQPWLDDLGQTLAQAGLRIRTVGADGNCFFRSCCDQMQVIVITASAPNSTFIMGFKTHLACHFKTFAFSSLFHTDETDRAAVCTQKKELP